MIRLAKLLKPGFLSVYLPESVMLLGPGAYVAVWDARAEGRVLGQAGELPDAFPEIARRPDVADNNTAHFPLRLEGAELGRLIVGVRDSRNIAADAAFMAAAGFVARSLEEILKREGIARGLGEETLDQYREVALMQRAVVNLNSSMKLHEVVRALLKECDGGAFPKAFGMVFLKEVQMEGYECFGAEVLNPCANMERFVGSRLFQEVTAEGKGEIVNDLSLEPRWNNECPGLTSALILPLRASRIALGALVLAKTTPDPPFTAAHLKKSATLASVAGIAMANAYHFEQVQEILVALIKAMATAIDSRDRLTAGHSQRVAQYALGLAQAASCDTALCPAIVFDEAELQEIFYAGLLHDVGKIGVREEVLTKATRLPRTHLELIGLRLALWGEINALPWREIYARFEIINKSYELSEEDLAVIHRFANQTLDVAGSVIPILTAEERDRFLTPRGNLTAAEWQEIKRHPEESNRILANIPFTFYFPDILTIILQHHERLDGSGYPRGAKAEGLLTQSRILAIVDIYDSLRRDRHYKKALSQDMALTILEQEARMGKLDQALVQLFCKDINRIEKTMASQTALFPARQDGFLARSNGRATPPRSEA